MMAVMDDADYGEQNASINERRNNLSTGLRKPYKTAKSQNLKDISGTPECQEVHRRNIQVNQPHKWSISKTYKIIWAALAASSMAANWRVDKIFKLSFSQVPHSVSSYECTCESSTTVLKAPPPMSAINDFKLNTEMLAFLT